MRTSHTPKRAQEEHVAASTARRANRSLALALLTCICISRSSCDMDLRGVMSTHMVLERASVADSRGVAAAGCPA